MSAARSPALIASSSASSSWRRTARCFSTKSAICGWILQAKLLRAIQEGEIERVGGTKPIKTEFRLIAATNVDLEKAVKEGRFREDLFYRINVIPIKLPPLRDRSADIPLLAEFFLKRYNARFRKQIQGITESTMAMLQKYWWPGNIRELENLIERLVAVERQGLHLRRGPPARIPLRPARAAGRPEREPVRGCDQHLRAQLPAAGAGEVRLERHGTSEYLGIPLSTLKYKMDKLDVRQLGQTLRGA